MAARKTLVEGAVGMVEMALDMLSGKKIAELNVDRRAMLVSNLMVVLCSERDTQPIVSEWLKHDYEHVRDFTGVALENPDLVYDRLDAFYVPFQCSGFLPCVLAGRESGFEIYFESAADVLSVGPSARLKRRRKTSWCEAKSFAPSTVLILKRRYCWFFGFPRSNTTMDPTAFVP